MSKALIVLSALLLSVSSVVPLEWRDDPSLDSWEIAVSPTLERGQQRHRDGFRGYTWYEARDICLSEGGDLLFQFDIDRIRNYFDSQYSFWSGINRLRNFSKWEWGPHDEQVPSTFPIEYSDGDGKCVAINRQDLSRSNSASTGSTMNCGKDLYHFVCKRKKGESTPLVLPPPIIADTNCPEGWQDAGTNRCYKVFEHPDKIEWKEAMEACTSLPYYNPNLACVNTPEEIDVLTRLVTYPYPASFWFGLLVEDNFYPWRWADSTRFTMNATNFHRDLETRHLLDVHVINYEPNRGMVIDNRAIPEGAWNFINGTIPLSPLRGYICQVEKDPNYNHTASIFERMTPEHDGNIDQTEPSECPEGWRDPGTHRCYKVFEHPTEFNWTAARAACRGLPYYKPNLACVNSTAETDVLARLVTSANHARFWFGLKIFLIRYPKEIVHGTWVDGQTFDPKLSNFHRYFVHPRLFDSGGGVIDNLAVPRGAWDIARFEFRTKWYICQIEKNPPDN